MDIIQLINKNRNQFKRTIYILKILLECKTDEENYNKLLFVERIYDSLDIEVAKYESTSQVTDYNILCNDFTTVESMLRELKEDVMENFRISSVVFLDNLKLDELPTFYDNFMKVMSNYNSIEQASNDIFYYSGKELSTFIMHLLKYINESSSINKRLIPIDYLEKHQTIISISIQEWIKLFNYMRTTMKYIDDDGIEAQKLKKDFSFLNVYYFIVLTGGSN